MDRLTERTAAGHGRIVGIKEESLVARLYKGEALKYFAASDRLAAYEDTGLTPEEIKAMVKVHNDMADRIEALTADKDEQAGRLMELDYELKSKTKIISELRDIFHMMTDKAGDNALVMQPDLVKRFKNLANEFDALLGGVEG